VERGTPPRYMRFVKYEFDQGHGGEKREEKEEVEVKRREEVKVK
jgi:hypothetical protein